MRLRPPEEKSIQRKPTTTATTVVSVEPDLSQRETTQKRSSPLQIRTRVMRRATPHLAPPAPEVYIVTGNVWI
ncbi:hypothetical protein A2U01_0052632 [Trifolium medium]|uniref:Uncharacterized protein n=1 Tax=Trifolium medium TaxID=97028 RepID=A0A392R6L0_9FABA|nr:hypothetical protein [Trifolium medium]